MPPMNVIAAAQGGRPVGAGAGWRQARVRAVQALLQAHGKGAEQVQPLGQQVHGSPGLEQVHGREVHGRAAGPGPTHAEAVEDLNRQYEAGREGIQHLSPGARAVHEAAPNLPLNSAPGPGQQGTPEDPFHAAMQVARNPGAQGRPVSPGSRAAQQAAQHAVIGVEGNSEDPLGVAQRQGEPPADSVDRDRAILNSQLATAVPPSPPALLPLQVFHPAGPLPGLGDQPSPHAVRVTQQVHQIAALLDALGRRRIGTQVSARKGARR